MLKMSVRTFYNFVSLHVGLERLKNDFKATMIKLAAKSLKFGPLPLMLTGYIRVIGNDQKY